MDSNFNEEDLGIGGSIHERYDKYFQMKKNLILNSQLKESQKSDLLHTNLSPVMNPYFENDNPSQDTNISRNDENKNTKVTSTSKFPSSPSTSTLRGTTASPSLRHSISNPEMNYYTTPIT